MDERIANNVTKYEEKYGLITKGLVDFIWVVDLATMQFIYVSSTVRKILGFSAEEMIGTDIRQHLKPKSYDYVVKILVQALDLYRGDQKNNQIESQSKTVELEFFHKDRSTVWLEATARLYKEKDNSIRIIGVSKNIDERKKFERDRETLIAKLEETLSEKERLLKENKILMGLLPICAECKKIRDEDGKWWQIEEYISSRTNAEFSHTICPDCKLKLYPHLTR